VFKRVQEDESHRKVKKAHKERLLTDCLSCVVYLVHRLLLIPILRTATDTHRDGGRQIERERWRQANRERERDTATDTHRDGGRQIEREREIQPQIHTEMEAGK